MAHRWSKIKLRSPPHMALASSPACCICKRRIVVNPTRKKRLTMFKRLELITRAAVLMGFVKSLMFTSIASGRMQRTRDSGEGSLATKTPNTPQRMAPSNPYTQTHCSELISLVPVMCVALVIPCRCQQGGLVRLAVLTFRCGNLRSRQWFAR